MVRGRLLWVNLNLPLAGAPSPPDDRGMGGGGRPPTRSEQGSRGATISGEGSSGTRGKIGDGVGAVSD